LYNICNTECVNVFDTQIAHRILSNSQEKENFKTAASTYNHNQLQNSISLNGLIMEYLKINNSIKDEIQIEMGKDPYFWKRRPLTTKMQEYAAKDVIYLPEIYNLMIKKCKMLYKWKNYQFKIDEIIKECEKYLQYPKINLEVKNFNKVFLPAQYIMEGLIK
jgi:ribonuclease D